MNILLAWLGMTDMDASKGVVRAGSGPIGRVAKELEFDEIHLLSNLEKREGDAYRAWLSDRTSARVTINRVALEDPMDFGRIYELAKSAADTLLSKEQKVELCFHLSPGTSAMAAVWILLAKTRYAAKVVQSSPEAGVRFVQVPFDISAEYVPLLQAADERLEGLSQGGSDEEDGFESVLFQSKVMKETVDLARRLARFDVPILIGGESGTGKEVFANAIHTASLRKDNPFIPVNCGAISEQLIESELFGHVKGAFTGADKDRDGHFVKADGGTIFLDEIGELPVSAQVKLLRVLQEGEIMSVGSSKTKKISVRVISATNRNLIEEVANGSFREDLFYRLAVFVLNLPPLREREGDIGLLADHFLKKLNERNQGFFWSEEKRLSPKGRNRLLKHSWPGNIRELEHAIYRASVFATTSRIGEAEVEKSIFPSIGKGSDDLLSRPLGNGFDLQELIAEVSRTYMARALAETHNNKSKAAKLVGLPSYQTFTNWMERYGVLEEQN